MSRQAMFPARKQSPFPREIAQKGGKFPDRTARVADFALASAVARPEHRLQPLGVL